MIFDYEDFDLSGVRTYPLASRKSKARSEDFAKPVARGASVPDFVAALPSILGAADFEAVKADLLAGGGVIVDSELTRSFGVVRVIAPLARLLGYSDRLARLTAGTGREVMWLSHYAPVAEPPPGNDVA